MSTLLVISIAVYINILYTICIERSGWYENLSVKDFEDSLESLIKGV